MIKELGELNEQFYILCSRLDKYCEKLSDEQHAYMQSVLLEQYKDEYTLLALKCGIETKREIDELQAKHARLVPHRWRVWGFLWRKKNYAAVLNDAKADEYAARTFAEIEARILAEARARCAEGTTDGDPGEELIEEREEGGENAGSSSEGGVDIAELEAQLAQEAWDKLAAKAESADPKKAKADKNDDVPEIPKNRDKNKQPAEDRARKNP